MYKLPLSPSDLSKIARQGSGSACRSLFGGFVAWEAGSDPSGTDSRAVEVAPREHWPEMEAIICVVSDAKKGTSSTAGMQRTVETSTLLQHRIKEVVPKRMAGITKAILEKDFDTFAKITMADSNSFHAVALDTEPPIFYMNDVSRAIIGLVVEYNRASVENGGKAKAAYTFDAGPNAVIYALKENVPEILGLVTRYFPPAEDFVDKNDALGGKSLRGADLPPKFNDNAVRVWEKGSVKSLIHTRVGDGPRVYSEAESLLKEGGLPKTLA
jgi:diphosphomevalonate decarboxylase